MAEGAYVAGAVDGMKGRGSQVGRIADVVEPGSGNQVRPVLWASAWLTRCACRATPRTCRQRVPRSASSVAACSSAQAGKASGSTLEPYRPVRASGT
jgi:hypothetical protein